MFTLFVSCVSCTREMDMVALPSVFIRRAVSFMSVVFVFFCGHDHGSSGTHFLRLFEPEKNKQSQQEHSEPLENKSPTTICFGVYGERTWNHVKWMEAVTSRCPKPISTDIADETHDRLPLFPSMQSSLVVEHCSSSSSSLLHHSNVSTSSSHDMVKIDCFDVWMTHGLSRVQACVLVRVFLDMGCMLTNTVGFDIEELKKEWDTSAPFAVTSSQKTKFYAFRADRASWYGTLQMLGEKYHCHPVGPNGSHAAAFHQQRRNATDWIVQKQRQLKRKQPKNNHVYFMRVANSNRVKVLAVAVCDFFSFFLFIIFFLPSGG